MDLLSITIRNFDKYQGRTDVKNHSWFRLSNRFLEDPDFFEFTPEEKLCWIYFLGLASIANHATIHVSVQRANRIAGLSKAGLTSAIKKLKEINAIEVPRTRSERGRYARVQDPCATEQNNTEQNNTEQNILHQQDMDATGSRPPVGQADECAPLIKIWNEFCGKLPKVKKSSALRDKKINRVWKNHSYEEWVEVIEKIAASDFCLGKSTSGWIATFDWLIQPDTSLKVLEGKYDNRTKVSETFAQRREDNLKNLEAEWNIKN